jgi:hypothetical protein
MDTTLPRSQNANVAFPSWARITPIVRSALVCGVLALALVSLFFIGAGLSAIPNWIQGLFAMGGAAFGTLVGIIRGHAA